MPTTPVKLIPYPAYTDPADVPADMHALAQRVEDLMVADKRGLSASVYSNAAQVFANVTSTKLAFQVVESDTSGMWRSGSNSFQVAASGLWVVWARCEIGFDAGGSGYRAFLEVYGNGSVLIRRGDDYTMGAAAGAGCSVSTQLRLTQGDTIEVHVMVVGGSGFTTPGQPFVNFGIAYLSP